MSQRESNQLLRPTTRMTFRVLLIICTLLSCTRSTQAQNQLPVIPPIIDQQMYPTQHNQLDSLADTNNLQAANPSQAQELDNHIYANQLTPSNNQPVDSYSAQSPFSHSNHQDQLQYQHQNHYQNNTIGSSEHKKASAQQAQALNKLQKYLNRQQHELVRQHPGSLLAVARALKMTITECQYQMRHEPWNCPLFGFGSKPADMFGKLMGRNFKETSFVHALLSSAIAHSVTRACTESMISTCGRLKTNDFGFKEDIGFGSRFAQQFMASTQEQQGANSLDSNLIVSSGSGSSTGSGEQVAPSSTSVHIDSGRRERKIKALINAHNYEVGLSHVLNGMRKECKCHGLSGACNMHTCWLKLPSFRSVASKLHDSFSIAIRVIYINQSNRQKSLTSSSNKKSNKKRSSVHPVNGLGRSSASINQNLNSYPPDSLSIETANIIGSRRKVVKSQTNTDNCEHCYNKQSADSNGGLTKQSHSEPAARDQQVAKEQAAFQAARNTSGLNAPSATKRRPVARSIGDSASTITPTKYDLLYYEVSPDFCNPDDRFDIKGTQGRICSENSEANDNCERLCCGRRYMTEIREEKYKCQCEFKFCCKLDCNICTRQKTIHKCL